MGPNDNSVIVVEVIDESIGDGTPPPPPDITPPPSDGGMNQGGGNY